MTKEQIKELENHIYNILCLDYRERYEIAYRDKNDKRDGYTVVTDCMKKAEADATLAFKNALDRFNDPGDEYK